jgi:hypothetical protein
LKHTCFKKTLSKNNILYLQIDINLSKKQFYRYWNASIYKEINLNVQKYQDNVDKMIRIYTYRCWKTTKVM